MEGLIRFITPEITLPPGVRILSTTRTGGVSQGPYLSLNPAVHVGDNPQDAEENRRRIENQAGLPSPVFYLDQCHSDLIVDLKAAPQGHWTPPRADGTITGVKNQVLGILTADCLPVIFWNTRGDRIGAVHGGWKGVAAGILGRSLETLGCEPGELGVWIGPAISGDAYEVGDDVRDSFLAKHSPAEGRFTPNPRGRWQFDLPGAAQDILNDLGVTRIFQSGLCTFKREDFYSYRRDGTTGRIATLVWIERP